MPSFFFSFQTESHYIAQACLKLFAQGVLLPQHDKQWDYLIFFVGPAGQRATESHYMYLIILLTLPPKC
jgi:hypothetical protein